MVATPISPVVRFQRAGNTSIVLIDMPAIPGAPTRAEIDAGVDITGDVQGVDGFTREPGFLDVPDWGSLETDQIRGRSPSSQGTVRMYADQGGPDGDIRAEVAEGDLKELLFMPHGDVPADKMTVFDVEIAGVNETFDDTAATLVSVGSAIRKRYTAVAIPASA
jgi:hypothetical protein